MHGSHGFWSATREARNCMPVRNTYTRSTFMLRPGRSGGGFSACLTSDGLTCEMSQTCAETDIAKREVVVYWSLRVVEDMRADSCALVNLCQGLSYAGICLHRRRPCLLAGRQWQAATTSSIIKSTLNIIIQLRRLWASLRPPSGFLSSGSFNSWVLVNCKNREPCTVTRC